jgi:hypothetical protein
VTPTRFRPPGRAGALAAFLLAAGVVAVAAQPPKEVEDPKAKPAKKVGVEDEDPGGKVKKKVIVDDADPPPKKVDAGPGGTPPDLRLDELARAAEAPAHPALKALFARFSVPFDLLTDARGAVLRVRALPRKWPEEFQGAQGTFPVTELTPDNQLKPVRPVDVTTVRKIDHYEAVALAEVDQVLKFKPLGTDTGPEGLTALDQLAAAETVLAAVIRFHDYGKDHKLREGKVWESFRPPLVTRLREVRLRQLKSVAATSDWAKTKEVGSKLLADYPQDQAVAQEVAAAWIGRATVLAGSPRDADKIQARELVDLVEARFPGAGGEAARKVRDQLRQTATDYAAEGEKAVAGNNVALARDYAERGYALDPAAPGVPELRRKLNISPSLYVAVRYFPTRLDPFTARTDGERQAVELLFEGLLEEVPDPVAGVRYRVGSAASSPAVVPGGRRVPIRLLPKGPDPRDGFDAHDIVGTLALLRQRQDTWAAAALPWFETLAPDGGGAVRVRFRHGHPDPRALLTFKLLPAGWLAAQKNGMADQAFADKPFGTGPFRVANVFKPGGNKPRELVLVPNRTYEGAGRDRKGQPHLTEIRLVESVASYDPAVEFQAGRLHLLPDPSPAELEKITKPETALMNKVKVVTAGTNRRVHLLAVNLRKPALRSRDLRKGLSQAISREAVLAELDRQFPVLRPYRRLTGPMTGPFPPKAWATSKGGVPLSDPDQGYNRLRAYLNAPGAVADLTLIYPSNNPKDFPFEDRRAAVACQLIKDQVEGLFKIDGNGRKMTIRLEPLPLPLFLSRLMDEHTYDLAYVPFDYPDDWYPYGLAALLEPSAGGPGGRNIVGFRVPGANPDGEEIQLGNLLSELRTYADFAGTIVPKTAEIHDKFNDVVPFIPLWQLDRQIVVSDRLRIYVEDTPKPADPAVLNPAVLFHNAARWRLE